MSLDIGGAIAIWGIRPAASRGSSPDPGQGHQVLDVSLENVLQELGDRLHSRERCAAWRSGLSRCLSRFDGDNDDDDDNDGDDGDDEHGSHVTGDDDDDYDGDYDVLCLSLVVMLLLYVRPCTRPWETLLLIR